jgi:hypothetical protein
MVVDISCKLVANLSSNERMGDVIFVEIHIQIRQIQTNILTYYIYTGTNRNGRIDVHHAGIEAIAGIGGHMAIGLQFIGPLIPVTEGHNVGMFQLAPLRHTCRTTGVKQDEKRMRLWGLQLHIVL